MMDVKEILQTQGDQLLDIDLDCLEDELIAGAYDRHYADDCRRAIDSIRKSRSDAEAPKSDGHTRHTDESGEGAYKQLGMHSADVQPISPLIVPSDRLSPFGDHSPVRAETPSETVARDLASIRRAPDAEKQFSTYLRQSQIIDEYFVDHHFDLFNEDELRTMTRKMRFSESFLEKYFEALDHKMVSLHQAFSEEFFLKHFQDLDVRAVLQKSPNKWARKGNRSSKLDVFLRLKGVRI